MSAPSSLNISLTPELEGFVRESVSTGRYATSGEVVREGLRLLQQRQREAEARFAALKEELRLASEEADRGEFVETEEVLKKARALIASRQEKKLP